jgi:hypothetical protein
MGGARSYAHVSHFGRNRLRENRDLVYQPAKRGWKGGGGGGGAGRTGILSWAAGEWYAADNSGRLHITRNTNNAARAAELQINLNIDGRGCGVVAPSDIIHTHTSTSFALHTRKLPLR